jgi:hypothetical protein
MVLQINPVIEHDRTHSPISWQVVSGCKAETGDQLHTECNSYCIGIEGRGLVCVIDRPISNCKSHLGKLKITL